MHEIDFLPAECRQNRAKQKWQAGRALIVAILSLVVVGATCFQYHRRSSLQADLADTALRHAEASQTKQQLTELQARLQVSRSGAELFVYLRHPWPSTRIIAALLRPLPDEITFRELIISQEALNESKLYMGLSREERKAKEERLASLPPAARDLEKLRQQRDPKQTVVKIAGLGSDSAALHRYLVELGKETLFRESQLDSIETDLSDPKTVLFSTTLVVRPGYGKPGGPSGISETVAEAIVDDQLASTRVQSP